MLWIVPKAFIWMLRGRFSVVVTHLWASRMRYLPSTMSCSQTRSGWQCCSRSWLHCRNPLLRRRQTSGFCDICVQGEVELMPSGRVMDGRKLSLIQVCYLNHRRTNWQMKGRGHAVPRNLQTGLRIMVHTCTNLWPPHYVAMTQTVDLRPLYGTMQKCMHYKCISWGCLLLPLSSCKLTPTPDCDATWCPSTTLTENSFTIGQKISTGPVLLRYFSP